MKAFRVSGQFVMDRGWQRFSKEVAAEDEARAKEIILSDLGSRHRVKRTEVKIVKVKELTPEEIGDSAVEYKVKGVP